jgi:hypothetical protein
MESLDLLSRLVGIAHLKIGVVVVAQLCCAVRLVLLNALLAVAASVNLSTWLVAAGAGGTCSSHEHDRTEDVLVPGHPLWRYGFGRLRVFCGEPELAS